MTIGKCNRGCTNSQPEVRKKVCTNGTIMYGLQCASCGYQVGPWLPKAQWPEDAPLWREGAASEFCNEQWELRRTIKQAEREQQSASFWRLYNEYLSSREWRDKRRAIFEREGGLCQGCRKNKGLHVHHLTYDRVGNEILTDLALLCEPCHDVAHNDRDDDSPWRWRFRELKERGAA